MKYEKTKTEVIRFDNSLFMQLSDNARAAVAAKIKDTWPDANFDAATGKMKSCSTFDSTNNFGSISWKWMPTNGNSGHYQCDGY